MNLAGAASSQVAAVSPARRGGRRHRRGGPAGQAGEQPTSSTAVAWEVVVADNRSTDGTVAVANSFADRLDLRVVPAPEKSNAAYARNVAVATSQAPWIAFVDADDMVAPGWVAPDTFLAGYGVVSDGSLEPMIHPLDTRTGLSYSLLPMIHAIAGDLLTPEQAREHLHVIAEHLLGPDGARLFDRPVAYRGGPTEIFQREEESSFFGREVGIMYMQEQLRYAEALDRVGD